MRAARVLVSALVVLCVCLGVCSCSKEEEPDFSGYQEIAELATMDCYYHNVAEINNDGTNYLFGINVGYKKALFEYDGMVTLGIDASKVEISAPDANGKVVISIPPARVLGLPDADESTFSTVYEDTGALTEIDAKDKSEAYSAAQKSMRESAENDALLMSQARNRAKVILKKIRYECG